MGAASTESRSSEADRREASEIRTVSEANREERAVGGSVATETAGPSGEPRRDANGERGEPRVRVPEAGPREWKVSHEGTLGRDEADLP